MKRVVEIVPLEVADQALLSALVAEIGRVFPLESRIGTSEKLPLSALDAERGQYHSTRILEHLAGSERRDAFRLLGVTSVDLFTPILAYVFGEAMLPGRAALVSTFRLADASTERDPVSKRSLFVDRVLKEGVHELGHTFGLTHCQDSACAMAASLDTTHIDAKSTRLCYYCQILLEDGLKL
jgi:archaemetzincin